MQGLRSITLQFYQATNPPAKPTQLPPKLTQPPSNPTQPTHQIQLTYSELRPPMASHDHPTHGDPRRATITSPTASHDYPWDSYPNPLPSHKQPPSNPTQPTNQIQSTHNEPRLPMASHAHPNHGDPCRATTTSPTATHNYPRADTEPRRSESHLPKASMPIWGREERVWEKERNLESARKRERVRLKNNLRVLNFLFLFLFFWVFILFQFFSFFFHLVKIYKLIFCF